MPNADPQRERQVAEALEILLKLNAEAPTVETERPVVDDGGPANLAEVLAVVASIVRDAQDDESIWAEATLKYIAPSRQSLVEARRVLSALRYDKITPVLARMIQSAPRQPAWLKARRQRKAERRKRLLEAHRTRH